MMDIDTITGKRYLGMISTGLMTRDEVIDAFTRFNDIVELDDETNQYIKELDKFHAFEPGEISYLASLINDALNVDTVEYAKSRLVEGYTHRVISVATQYAGLGVPVIDLIQDGIVGLLQCISEIEQYTVTISNISLHVHDAIRDSMMRTITNRYHAISKNHSRKVVNRLTRIAEFMNDEALLTGKYPSIHKLVTHTGEPMRDIIEVLALYMSDVSYDECAEYIYNPIDDIDHVLDIRTLKDAIHQSLLTVTDRERLVLDLRYGLSDGIERSFADIGDILGVSRSRAKQIVDKALRKLRHPSRANHLTGYRR